MISLSHLTELDKDILTQSWKIVSRDMESLAVDIFQMIFEQAPDAKLMFTFMMRDYREDDKKSSEFTFHALRFIQVIESTMNHLEDPETLDPLFLNLGKIHARHEEHLGFSSHYWSVFKECVLFHFRKSMKADHKLCKKSSMSLAEIDSSIILWREVLRFIITRMKTGLESNGLIRKANREEMINGVAYDNGVHVLEDTKQGVTQAVQDLRRTDKSLFVPEYFLRRSSQSDEGDST
ncbi:hypothetical protein Y032_0131g1634 [Ancylostoma ceylanicum]|uniref:Globin domain-containing protein n=1 Tax=Ancylostoma ceylanicum TaxID=53326 RepID=A0A016T711_9BILA|nr:hypothetical protein Y032_0131g1634 [Ancylostoma ceylanicum]